MLKDAILERGKALNQDVLLVDSFLNHQVDVALMEEIGEEFAKYFADRGITRVVTIESSGIAPASFTALALGLPLVIMKKQTSRILKGDLLQTTVRSFTKGTQYELTVKREFLPAGEKILLIDDFLASGEAAFGVIHLAQQAGAEIAGIGIVIEKAFQSGHQRLADEGMDVYSLARIASLSADAIPFAESTIFAVGDSLPRFIFTKNLELDARFFCEIC